METQLFLDEQYLPTFYPPTQFMSSDSQTRLVGIFRELKESGHHPQVDRAYQSLVQAGIGAEEIEQHTAQSIGTVVSGCSFRRPDIADLIDICSAGAQEFVKLALPKETRRMRAVAALVATDIVLDDFTRRYI